MLRVKPKETIRHGVAIVPVHMTLEGLQGWMLPGCRFTMIEEEARRAAQEMDNLMTRKLGRLGARGHAIIASWRGPVA